MSPGADVRLFNSMGRTLVPFEPMREGVARIYTCGLTVYSDPHLGNLRPYVFSDSLRRLLEWKGYAVEQVVNITDVGHAVGDGDEGEDKVETTARAQRLTPQEVAEHYTELFFQDLQAINVLPAHHSPRASAYVEQMIEFAKVIEEHGYTYLLPAGLYFDTTKSAGYGKLAMMPNSGQLEGARVSTEGKRSAADFAIWRSDPPDQRRIMRWDSPWGPGVPGWHLECSVMSISLLGPHFDIHTGGVDHRQIHHPNEIAQSEAYLEDGQDWVPLWMHNEFLLQGGAKISKSAGKMPTLRDLTDDGYPAMAFRYFLLTSHYRRQMDLTEKGLQAALSSARRLAQRVAALGPLPDITTFEQAGSRLSGPALAVLNSIDDSMSEDLNTPRVLADLQVALRSTDLDRTELAVLAAAALWLLGLDLSQLAEEPGSESGAPEGVATEQVEALMHAREQARSNRQWAEADRLREELASLGVQVVDTAEGSRWSIAP
ncbi:cysteine--tRNA ligase [Jatrophihabitans sp.]|uniref:cysteine--tRNA ligase n=1 Tax=Jatrophihabitans sp. TaxID=1932789 RepID=UPI002EE86DE8